MFPTAIRAVKQAVPNLLVWADVCMCEYTSHGHCGILNGQTVDNDATLAMLVKESVVYAEAGADIIAPSDMMDGRIGAMRTALESEGHQNVMILSYAAKYASSYYGPFRDAVGSAGNIKGGDKKTYQMDPANSNQAMAEIQQDIAEGADIIMVKPALAYLDVIRRASREFDLPLAAYNVSGEYSMIKAAAERGWIDGERAMEEALLSIKRAGADWILTYAAADLAEKLPA